MEEGSGFVPAGQDEVAARVVLPERCGECHAAEFDVWRTTTHATGFDTLHRSDRAKDISRNLGLRLMRRSAGGVTPACLSCHYTPVPSRDGLRAGGGVSCESCHGPAREWIGVHSDYGVPEADFQKAARLETAVHREKRIADSVSAGMRRSSDLYALASTCFACHTVPNEELVNRGGHSPGGDFELVAGNEAIRHNFLDSYRSDDGRTNAERIAGGQAPPLRRGPGARGGIRPPRAGGGGGGRPLRRGDAGPVRRRRGRAVRDRGTGGDPACPIHHCGVRSGRAEGPETAPCPPRPTRSGKPRGRFSPIPEARRSPPPRRWPRSIRSGIRSFGRPFP